ncbi:MAG: indolepyruvate ferredoxin oxidoreductase [Tannerellaceae bacterium]|jgi:indolepyruvate ferredoxin oxidoreductase alpha subunit|nr:indolepyruvate ferredoxin oxidoreductase [Tannerellaceae bacterium]
MEKYLFLGDEAIAQAAIDAGLSGVYAYPGTPSTEITEYIQSSAEARARGVHSRWSVNEKTALEAALGMSYAGKRALCCMKHVGLNVAADCFMNVAMSGVNGGLIVVTADDPSMHSSQNEQDNRVLGNFAMVPILEPSSQQEAYDMVYSGFRLSERLGYPILLRITTRMAHSRAGVTTQPPCGELPLSFPSDGRQRFILLPVNARKRFKALLDAQSLFTAESDSSPYNAFFDAPDRRLGIVTCGIAFNYVAENFPDGFTNPVLKICQYPLPRRLVEDFTCLCDEIVVVEEGFPVVEEKLKGFLGRGVKVRGRLDGSLPRDGELTPSLVAGALGIDSSSDSAACYMAPGSVVPRPPALCAGCGHRDLYDALNAVASRYEGARVFSDIGCYTLGAMPPFYAIESCVDMGASITMAKGAADAGVFPALCVIGDSTFTHSGMTGLLDCVNEKASVTIIISDNETTAMTGGQDSAGTGRLEAICLGIGVEEDHLHVLVPLKKNARYMEEVIQKEIEYRGVSVIIPRRQCIQTLKRKQSSRK